jgi:hydrogenase maturation protease
VVRRILVAGVGNILRGDDGLGPYVVKVLRGEEWPPNVDIIDFGIRLYDLLLKIGDYDLAVIVDALDLGGDPGEIYILEPGKLREVRVLDPHTSSLADILAMAERVGKLPGKVVIVGCQPAELCERIGLSKTVEGRITEIINIIKRIVGRYI